MKLGAKSKLNKTLSYLCFSSLIAQSAAAQDIIEEVLVTATKRGAASVQDIPISIQAMDSSKLEEIGALNFNDYFRQVPGLDVADQGPGDKRYIIRGVNATGAGTVGLYFGEIIVTGENAQDGGGRQPDIKLFDMDRVEVLRGPQGSTFGSSSLTGTIRLIPQAPDLEKLSFSAGAGLISSEESSGVGYRVDAAVNIPLVENKLAVRLSALKVDQEGYIDNRFEKDGNNDDSDAFRGILRWQASENLDVSIMAMHQDQESGGRPFYHAMDINAGATPGPSSNPVPSFFNANFSRQLFQDEIDMYNLTLNYTEDWGTITATTSSFERETVFDRDASVPIQIFTTLVPPSGPPESATGFGRSVITQPKDRELVSNEIRFASNWDGNFQLLAGAFYQEEERFFQSRILTADGSTGNIGSNPFVYLDRNESTDIEEKAIFGELEIGLTDKLTATLGGRWFDFEIVAQANELVRIARRPGRGITPLGPFSESGSIFKANLSYQATDDTLVYLQAAEGFRSGGTNDLTFNDPPTTVIPAGFESDSLINYELGIKSTLLDNRLTINTALYYIDWSDLQVQRTVSPNNDPAQGSFPFRGNGGKASVKGLELEIIAHPAEGLDLNLGANFNKSQLEEDFPVAASGRDGDDIPNVPDFTLSFGVRYERPVFDGLTGFFGGEWSYTDEQTTEFRPDNAFFREVDAYSLLNLRVGVNGDDWSAVLSVNNALDEDETTNYLFDFRGPQNSRIPEGLLRPWPRTIALNLRKSF